MIAGNCVKSPLKIAVLNPASRYQFRSKGWKPHDLVETGSGEAETRNLSVKKYHSFFSPRTGSTDAARRAGITPATQAAAISIPTATANELLLTVVSSYSCDFTNVTP